MHVLCGVCVGVDEMDGDDGGKPGGDTPKGLKVGVDTPFHIIVGCSNGGGDTPKELCLGMG